MLHLFKKVSTLSLCILVFSIFALHGALGAEPSTVSYGTTRVMFADDFVEVDSSQTPSAPKAVHKNVASVSYDEPVAIEKLKPYDSSVAFDARQKARSNSVQDAKYDEYVNFLSKVEGLSPQAVDFVKEIAEACKTRSHEAQTEAERQSVDGEFRLLLAKMARAEGFVKEDLTIFPDHFLATGTAVVVGNRPIILFCFHDVYENAINREFLFKTPNSAFVCPKTFHACAKHEYFWMDVEWKFINDNDIVPIVLKRPEQLQIGEELYTVLSAPQTRELFVARGIVEETAEKVKGNANSQKVIAHKMRLHNGLVTKGCSGSLIYRDGFIACGMTIANGNQVVPNDETEILIHKEEDLLIFTGLNDFLDSVINNANRETIAYTPTMHDDLVDTSNEIIELQKSSGIAQASAYLPSNDSSHVGRPAYLGPASSSKSQTTGVRPATFEETAIRRQGSIRR